MGEGGGRSAGGGGRRGEGREDVNRQVLLGVAWRGIDLGLALFDPR